MRPPQYSHIRSKWYPSDLYYDGSILIHHPDPLPEGEKPLRENQTWQAEQKLMAQLDNYGIYRLERLPGNVGCIDIRYFHRPDWAGDTAVAAMSFLSNASAWII